MSKPVKKIDSNFFKTISWDNLSIEPMIDTDFKVKYNNPNKLSHNELNDADEGAKAFMPEGDYAEGYITFVNSMPEE